jgi:hypothetical protein
MDKGYMTAVERANAAKAARNTPPTCEWDMLFEQAQDRVRRSPRMRKYQDIIFGDWSPWPDHLRWVIRGKVSEIVAWAEQIRRDSAQDS